MNHMTRFLAAAVAGLVASTTLAGPQADANGTPSAAPPAATSRGAGSVRDAEPSRAAGEPVQGKAPPSVAGPLTPVPLASADASVSPPASTPFGYAVFTGGNQVTEGPVDEGYLLGPGDQVVVSVWGELNETLDLEVLPEGFIELPDNGGRIQTNGVTLRELRPLMMEGLSRTRAGFIDPKDPTKSTAFVDVRLGRIRPLMVHVVGEVARPGLYPISAAVANVVNLLGNAGGVKTTGSLREVRIRRADGSIDTVDLYGFLLRWDLDPKALRVRSGDYVIVPLKQRSATIEGQVRRPMTYELVGKEGLRELLEFAGGVTPDAYLRQAQLRRVEANKGESLIDLDIGAVLAAPGGNLALLDRDVLTVGSNVQVRRPVVTIRGEGVLRPGTYEWRPGMRLSDLVAKAEGLREYAYLQRADLIRTDDDFTKRLVTFPLTGLYSRRADGTFECTPDTAQNLPLREMDEVVVQSSWGLAGRDKSVTLTGKVKAPGSTTLAKGMKLHDLLFMNGGFQDPDFAKDVFMDMAHVIRRVPGATGQRIIAFDLGKLLAGDAAADMELEDGDMVRVYSFDDLSMAREVQVSGIVKSPGAYPMAEGLTLEDVLVMAGGLRPEAVQAEAVIARAEGDQGSRDPALVVAVDRQFASKARELRTPLRNADRIVVRHKLGSEPRDIVTVAGEVRFPGNYAMVRRGETVAGLVKLAGGLREEAYPAAAILRRSLAAAGGPELASRTTTDVTIDLPAALADPGGKSDVVLKDGDLLFVPTSSGAVEVRGAVARPILVQCRPGSKLSEYVAMCGGYLERADVDRVTVSAPNNATRLVRRGEDPVLAAGSVVQVPLQRETDRLQLVEVKGAVAQPAMIQFIEGAQFGYYVGICGGFAANADLDKVAVLLPDGRILAPEAGRPFNPPIPAGAVIVVTARPSAGAK